MDIDKENPVASDKTKINFILNKPFEMSDLINYVNELLISQ